MNPLLERILWEAGSKTLEALYQHMKDKYGDNHPKVIQALATLDVHNDNEPTSDG